MTAAELPSDDDLHRLRQALRGTAERPRPLAPIEIPAQWRSFLEPQGLARLRPAAVLVPVIERDDAATVVLTRRAENLRQHGGQISFPGGSRDPTDADAIAAALREAEEEIGLDRSRVELIGFLDDYPTVTGFRVTPVVGAIRGPFTARPSPAEVAEIIEVPLRWILKVENYRRVSITRGSVSIPVMELNYASHRIWGATAGMLWNLCQKVSGER